MFASDPLPAATARMGLLAGCLALPLGLFGTQAANAAEDNGFFSLETENDFFFAIGTDRHYTNGVKMSWTSAPREDLPDWLYAVSAPPLFTGNEDITRTTHRVGLSLAHEIFTPADTQQTAPQPNDRPYAAWLHTTLLLMSTRYSGENEAWQDKWQLDLGVVGPAAMGEEVQNGWHRTFGWQTIKGWDNQIHNEPGVNLTLERAWRSGRLQTPGILGLETDFIPYGVIALGNVSTFAGFGGTLRLGSNLPDDFGPTGIYPSNGGSDWFIPTTGFNWYGFVGASGRYVARNIFLDGNTFRDSASIDKRAFVADLKAGLVAVIWDTRLSLTNVYRTYEFYGQPEPDMFGSLTVSFAL
ncbi:MAG: lipid A deacylase LpxR family protein [Parvibaculum sp.]